MGIEMEGIIVERETAAKTCQGQEAVDLPLQTGIVVTRGEYQGAQHDLASFLE